MLPDGNKKIKSKSGKIELKYDFPEKPSLEAQVSKKIVVIFAHHNFTDSRIQRSLLKGISKLQNVEIRDLYKLYPDYFIDAKKEQSSLAEADLIIFQHPINWYSSPAILKEWQDIVLEYGYAYGEKGTALKGKDFLQVISTGGSKDVYQTTGNNRFKIEEFLRPFEATAYLCGIHYHKPFVVHEAYRISDEQLEKKTQDYVSLLNNYLENGNAVLQSLNTHNF